MDPKDLLLADLGHFEESLWRNEEIGEKRFNFFVTLVTAVAAGLVALFTGENNTKLSSDQRQTILVNACSGLLFVGFITYFRMLHRNRVTDQHKETTKYIRKKYRSLSSDLSDYRVPVPMGDSGKLGEVRQKWLRGGYAETMAAFNGLILAVTLWAYMPSKASLAITAGLLLTVVLWRVAAQRVKSTE